MSLSNLLKNFFSQWTAPRGAATNGSVPVTASSEGLETLRVVDLKSMAREQGLKGYSKLSKAQLVELLK